MNLIGWLAVAAIGYLVWSNQARGPGQARAGGAGGKPTGDPANPSPAPSLTDQIAPKKGAPK